MSIYYSRLHSDAFNLSVQHISDSKMYAVVGVQLPHPMIKYSAGILYLFLSLSSILLNLLWGVILYVGHRHFSQRPFYIASRHLMVSDILCSISQLAIAVPLSFMNYSMGLGRGFWYLRKLHTPSLSPNSFFQLLRNLRDGRWVFVLIIRKCGLINLI